MVFRKKTTIAKNKASEMPQKVDKKKIMKFAVDEDEDDDDDDDMEGDDDNIEDDSDEAGDVDDSEDEDDDSEDDDDDDDDEEEESESDDELETNKMRKKVANNKELQKSGKKQMLDLSQKRNIQLSKKDLLQQKLKMDTSQSKPSKKDSSLMKSPKNTQGLSPSNDKKPVSSTLLLQQKQKTPKKDAEQTKFAASKSPQSRMVEESTNWEMQRKKERDARNLFIRNLPTDVSVEEIKSLSPDILGVSIPHKSYKKSKTRFAFLEFSNEQKAEENYALLQKKTVRSCEIYVDYVGDKSKNRKATDTSQGKAINKTKLYASGLPVECNMEDIAKLFPNAFSITFNNYPEHRACIASFRDEATAEETYRNCSNAKIRGRAITVLYSLERQKNKRKRKQKGKDGNTPQKRIKQEQLAKMESEEEEEDDDDDDDDDE